MTMDPVHGRAIAYAQECLESKGSSEVYCPLVNITLVDKS